MPGEGGYDYEWFYLPFLLHDLFICIIFNTTYLLVFNTEVFIWVALAVAVAVPTQPPPVIQAGFSTYDHMSIV